MRARWIAACCMGEAAGIAIVATVYAALDRGLIANAAFPILAAGAWEGLSLGGSQAWALRNSGIEGLRWVCLTVLGAVIGYGLSLHGGAGSGGPDTPEPPFWLVILLGGAMGLGMGAVMGALQWLAARPLLRAARWISASMIGWASAMAAIMAGAASAEASWPLGLVCVAGAISGGVAGALLGIVTGPALPSDADGA